MAGLVRPHTGFVLYDGGMRHILKREDIFESDHPWVKTHRQEFEPVEPTYSKDGQYHPGQHRSGPAVEQATDNPGESRHVRIPTEDR